MKSSSSLAWLFIALNVLPTAVFVAAAKVLGWSPEFAGGLRIPLIFTPLVTCLALTAWAEGPAAVERLGARFFELPPRRIWLGVALLVFPVLAVVALWVRGQFFGLPVLPRPGLTPWSVLGLSLFLFFFPGVTEELGWRGFLQPRLEQQLSPLVSSLVVGLTWGLWHGHSLASDPDRYNAHTYPWFLLVTVGAALVIGWLAGRGNHSVPLAMTGHFSANAVFFFFPMAEEVQHDGLIWKIYALVVTVAGFLLHVAWPLRRGIAKPATHEDA